MEQASLQAHLAMRASGGSEPKSEVAAVQDDEPRAIKVVVNPLSAREAGVFLSNVYNVAIGPNLLRFLHRSGRGNPRAMLECFKALQDQELIKLDPVAGTVEETMSLEDIGDMVFIIPMHLRAQLQQQLDKLMGREQLILKLASVTGSSFSVALLKWLYRQRVASTQQDTAATSLSAAIEGGAAVDPQAERTRVDNEFYDGLNELKNKGFMRPIRPFSQSHHHHYTRRQSSDRTESSGVDDLQPHQPPPQQRESMDDDDHWFFETDHIRFMVYSQTLHTMRCEVHGEVLDWYRSRPAVLRRHEDPVVLANHALGAENPQVAFACFLEGLRRMVSKSEQVSRGERLWQSCSDLLDDSNTGLPDDAVTAYRVVIDVLMGHVCIQNEMWDEGKAYFNRAVEAAEQFLGSRDEPLLTTRASSFATGATSFCLPFRQLMQKRSRGPTMTGGTGMDDFTGGGGGGGGFDFYSAHERDCLSEVEFHPLQEAKSHLRIARTCLKRIEELQQSHERMVRSLKQFSLNETVRAGKKT